MLLQENESVVYQNESVVHRQSELHWYGLTARPQHEKTVAKCLKQKEFQTLLPTYRAKRIWAGRKRVVELPLFRGYVFSRFDARDSLAILRTPGVTSIIGFGNGPIPLGDQEISDIERLCFSGYPLEPTSFLTEGTRVQINGGCLTGVEGIFIEARNHFRVVVSVTLLQRSVAIEIERDLIHPLS